MSGSGHAAAIPPRRPAKRDVSALRPLSVAGASPALSVATQLQRPRDPIIEEALQLKTFEADYSTEALVGSLSEKLIAESKRQAGPFDPKPFLQTFSPALDSLLSLRQQTAERTKKMESDVRRAEREYGKRLRELDGGFETIGSSFSHLETKITDVGRSAVRIGEQLESLHQTRSTAQSVSLLLSYYLSLCHHTSTTPDPSNPESASTPLDQLFEQRTSREGRTRLAIVLRRLMAVARDVAENSLAALNDAEAAVSSKSQAANGNDGDSKDDVTRIQKQISQKRRDKEKAERVRDEIERYCERFEKEVLRLFDRSYRKGDPKMMAHCAKTLQDFNGGASCVQIYVNQHDFFISKDRILDDDGVENGEAKDDFWSAIGNPDASPPTSEPGIKVLFKDIRITVNQEAQIVNAVFPDPNAVMENFLQRVFAQVIQQQLEALVSRAQSISTLATLRVLHLVHQQCSALCEDLKSYDVQMRSLPSSSRVAAPTGGPLAAILDRALEELFVPYLEGSRYMDSETKNLVELYVGMLSRFTRYHETVLKAKPNSLLDKVVTQLSTSTTAASSSSTAQAARSAIAKYANVFTSAGTSVGKASMPPQSPPSATRTQLSAGLSVSAANSGRASPMPSQLGGTGQRADLAREGSVNDPSPTDGVLRVEVAERMLKWHAEAIGRSVELSLATEMPKNSQALYRVLTGALGRSMIETGLDSAIARCDQHDLRNEPDLTVLAVLKPANLINHLWQRYSSTALFPLASGSAPIRKELASLYSHDLVRMENKMNHLIQRSLDLIVNWLSNLLTRQKKNDFKPKDEALSFARNNTEPCTLCCEFLDVIRHTAEEGLNGKNGEAFLTEVGVAFHSLLLDHFKKFPVNPTGGLMLTKDLASYQETMSRYGVPAVNERFDMLRQLGNSFIVQPNVLKSYMTESHLGRIDPRLLRPYLAQRSDYSQFSRSLNLDDGLPPEDVPSSGQAAIGHLTHLPSPGGASNRFSVISGVAGAGMGKLREMLKDFESMSPEEEAAADERARRYNAAARKASLVNANARVATNRQAIQPVSHFPMFMH